MTFLSLTEHWQLKQRNPQIPLAQDFATSDEAGWLAATVPGVVQQDLLNAALIPDPFTGLNEGLVQWVGEVDWLYRTSFELSAELIASEQLDLCFDGLDTFATVWLNGVEILSGDNMFVPYRLNVKSWLKPGTNELHILFESALRRGNEREQQYGERVRWNANSASSRLYVRKAQYHYGWDWGPTLITAGIWQAVRLEAYTARLSDLACPVELSADLSRATLPVSLVIMATGHRTGLSVELSLYGPDEQLVIRAKLPLEAGQTALTHTFELTKPQLWWVHGYGAQPFYRLESRLLAGTSETDEYDRQSLRLGLRRIRLVQEPISGQAGSSFYFEVNNVPIFSGGANWIPADSFLPRLTEQHYRQWLETTAEANMVMVRVWGGGIYESDVFYDLCDELGLLVWQDFMFACGMYPAYDWFQTSVQAEAEANVRRIRHHACLAVWCGNNEDYMLAASIGAYDPAAKGELADSLFPARAIYEKLLPEICQKLDPVNAYWPGSPYAGADGNSATEGDRHTWEIWHGPMAEYHQYGAYKGRFVSEFGMQALPVARTIEAFAAPEERFVGSRTLDHHNKASDGFRRLAVYLSDNLAASTDFDQDIYATQLVQAESLGTAVRDWRREWAGPGQYRVGGALVWQINDCWPVTSWAVVDYFGRPKPAYYVLRRQLAPLALGIVRPIAPTGLTIDRWAVNGALTTLTATLVNQRWSLDGQLLAEDREVVALRPNQTTELPAMPGLYDQPVIMTARLEVAGEVVARSSLWPEPFKYYQFADPELELKQVGENQLELRVKRPAKGVWLEAVGSEHLRWSDNMVDLLPDDPQTLTLNGFSELRDFTGLTGVSSFGEIKVHYLGGARRFNLQELVELVEV